MLNNKTESRKLRRKPVIDEHDRRTASEQRRLRRQRAQKKRHMLVDDVDKWHGETDRNDAW